jgi:hypothetical protein
VITIINAEKDATTEAQAAVEAAAAAVDSQAMPVWQQWMTIFSTNALRND